MPPVGGQDGYHDKGLAIQGHLSSLSYRLQTPEQQGEINTPIDICCCFEAGKFEVGQVTAQNISHRSPLAYTANFYQHSCVTWCMWCHDILPRLCSENQPSTHGGICLFISLQWNIQSFTSIVISSSLTEELNDSRVYISIPTPINTTMCSPVSVKDQTYP